MALKEAQITDNPESRQNFISREIESVVSNAQHNGGFLLEPFPKRQKRNNISCRLLAQAA
jgi:hypothetical protein